MADEPDELKPDVQIKMKQGDITSTLDDKIKASPELAAELLAEAKAWAEKQQIEAQALLKAKPSLFKRDMPWSYDRSYFTEGTPGHYISVSYRDYLSTGAARAKQDVNTILWDSQNKKRADVRPFFKETADNGPTMTALLGLVRKGIDAEQKERLPDNARPKPFTGLDAKMSGIGAISLATSTEPNKSAGLIFNYAPQAVDPSSDWLFHIFVSWRSFAPFLSPEGVAIFGGEQPDEDKGP